ncbi:hypothetical protein SDC9_162990 [bioreactor metagenome]|uniref:Uncharacterized protein n=1 Tax=bioreactor metagenome TaxID=1076179 RepID=A0A645FPM6_9ZZZZ
MNHGKAETAEAHFTLSELSVTRPTGNETGLALFHSLKPSSPVTTAWMPRTHTFCDFRAAACCSNCLIMCRDGRCPASNRHSSTGSPEGATSLARFTVARSGRDLPVSEARFGAAGRLPSEYGINVIMMLVSPASTVAWALPPPFCG